MKRNKEGLVILLTFAVAIAALIVIPNASYVSNTDKIVEAIKKQEETVDLEFIEARKMDTKELVGIYQSALLSPKLTETESQNVRKMNLKVKRNSKTKITSSATFTITYKNSKEDIEYARQVAKDFKDRLPSGLEEKEELESVYNFVIDRFNYNFAGARNEEEKIAERNIKNALDGKPVVCDAYAMMTNILLDELGYKNEIVKADVYTNGVKEAHAWVVVKTSKGWYHMDTTWGDSKIKTKKDFNFLKTEEDLYRTGNTIKFFKSYPRAENIAY